MNVLRTCYDKIKLPLMYLKAAFLFEFPTQRLSAFRPGTQSDLQFAIPRVVYQTWDTNLFGRTHLREIEKFREMNPEYTFHFFDTLQMEEYMRTNYGHHPIYSIFSKIHFGASKVDVFRYCLLYREGGWYFDINKRVNIPLREICSEEDQAVVAYETLSSRNEFGGAPSAEISSRLQYPENTFVQWGFGFAKTHPILQEVIDEIVRDYPAFRGKRFRNVKKAILDFTATHKWTEVIWTTFAKHPQTALKVRQCGIDFYRHGNFNVHRSWSRYLTRRSYADFRNKVIVD